MNVVSFIFSENDMERIVKRVGSIPKVLMLSQNRALFSVGNFMRFRVRDYILSDFKTESAITTLWKKRFTRGETLDPNTNPFVKREVAKTKAFSFMAPLVRFQAFPRENMLLMGFGYNLQGGQFDQKLLTIAKHMIEGYKMQVTPKMRRLFALTGKGLKKSTKQLVVKPRPLYQPVMNASRDMALQIYMATTTRNFRQEIRKVA